MLYCVDVGTIWAMRFVLLDLAKENAPIIVAVLALVAAIWQGIYNREHNRLSVSPLLTTKENVDIKGNIMNTEFKLINCGAGPAIIKNVVVRFEGEKIAENSHIELLDFMIKNLQGCKDVKIGFIGFNSVIKAGDEQNLWAFKHDVTKRDTYFIDKVNVLVEYQSVYKNEIIAFNSKEDARLTGKTPSTAQIMAQIHADCFTIPRPWNKQEFADMLPNPNVFYIIRENGFVIGQRVIGGQVELLSLAVIPKQQNAGHGRALLNDFIAEVKSKDGQSIFLEVAENNASALHLYEKAGFKKTGTRTSYYEVPNAPNIDAITMRLDIQTP